MKVNNKWLVVLLLAAALPLSGCGFFSKLRARDSLNKGVKAFTEQKYEQAAQFFEEAIRLDPEFQVARMYLATTYTSQFVPGSPDPKSNEMADKAIKTFEEVLRGGAREVRAALTPEKRRGEMVLVLSGWTRKNESARREA